MNSQEAKFILRAYRADKDPQDTPVFADALLQAHRDPALLGWLARERAFDGVVESKLDRIAPPADLRTAILAGSRASVSEKRALGFPLWLIAGAIAAAMVVAFVLPSLGPTVTKPEGEPLVFVQVDGANLGQFAAYNLTHGPHRHVNSPAAIAIERALTSGSGPVTQTAGLDFASLRTAGCQTFAAGEREVVEVCFKRNGVWYHLYVTQCHRTGPAAAVVAEHEGATVATWSDESNVYALVTRGGRDAIASVI